MDHLDEPYELLVVGGRQRKRGGVLGGWDAYDQAVVLSIDSETLEPKTVVEYCTPPEYCADRLPSIVFKAGDLSKDSRRLVVCTETELIEFDTDDWNQTFYYSHPWFNDVHHVCYFQRENLLVANTGLDQVIMIRRNEDRNELSEVANQWSSHSGETWEKFDRSVDYRKVASTKPHVSHPNFVFSNRDSIFVTRFGERDAKCLTEEGRDIGIAIGNPHDGIVGDASVTFTTTNGHLVSCDLETGENLTDIDLNSFSKSKESLGWCRGLCFPNPREAWVGFSRIRPTWLRENLSWIKRRVKPEGSYGALPTRITRYDLESEALIDEIELEDAGLHAVFGIYRKVSRPD